MKSKFGQKLREEIAIWRAGALPGIIVIALVVVARLTGSLQFLEWIAFDRFLRWRPTEPVDQHVVIVGINEADIRRVGYPISDRNIASLLNQLQTYQPVVIGLDIFKDLPIQPGHTELTKTFQTYKNIIAIDKVLPDQSGMTVNPPPSLPPEQVGFADAIFDGDGYLRRSLLGTFNADGDYRFSLSLRLAESYLANQGIMLDNGVRDPEAMRFGNTELTRFQPNFGGYVGADAGGNQILLNFRSGKQPFQTFSLQDIQTGNVDPDRLRGKVVLVGITAPSVKDVVTSSAIVSENPALIYGVEIQAHAVSQMINAVLHQRPLVQTWSDSWEYGWIILWGFLGISLGRFIQAPIKILLGLALAGVSLTGLSYLLLLQGWWIPLVPALLALVLNGAGLTASMFYRYQQDLRSRIHDRQIIIEYTFNAIHNGPLQTLAKLLRETQEKDVDSQELTSELTRLNHELRTVYESVRRETLAQNSSFYLGSEQELNLQEPMHEILYEVYLNVLNRDFPCFQALKLKVLTFEPLNEQHLSLEQKRNLCRFLEEALCNVGKHAIAATRLDVVCAQVHDQNVIRVSDNGQGLDGEVGATKSTIAEGFGSRQAKNLAKQLSGKFRRFPNTPQGTVCELTWSAQKAWFWQFG